MAGSFILVVTAVAVISFLVVVMVVRLVVSERSLVATPNIPREKAVLSAFASAKIRGTVDEVFKFIISYEDPDGTEPAAFSQYRWEDISDEGSPAVGSTGTFKLDVDPFGPRIIPVTISSLDHEKHMVSEITNKYPSWLLASERVQAVVPIPGEPHVCEYRSYMTIQGIAGYYLLLAAREELDDSQKRCADNLREHFLQVSKAHQI